MSNKYNIREINKTLAKYSKYSEDTEYKNILNDLVQLRKNCKMGVIYDETICAYLHERIKICAQFLDYSNDTLTCVPTTHKDMIVKKRQLTSFNKAFVPMHDNGNLISRNICQNTHHIIVNDWYKYGIDIEITRNHTMEEFDPENDYIEKIIIKKNDIIKN